MFASLDSRGEGRFVIVRIDLDACLQYWRAAIEIGRYEMNRSAVYVITGFESASMRMQTFVSRQQRRVNIEQSPLQRVNERGIKNAHIACEEYEVGL